MRKVDHSVLSAEIRYDFTKAELEVIIRKHADLPDGTVEWDISNTGKIRGASIKVNRTEIKS